MRAWWLVSLAVLACQAVAAPVRWIASLAGAFLTASCSKRDLIGELADERRTNDNMEPRVGILMSRVLTCVFLTAGCSSGDDTIYFQCHAPTRTTYDCSPLPSGSFGCVGGPVWFKGAPGQHDGGAMQDDPDAIFPVGCRARVPDCLTFESGRGFYCGSDGTVAGWGEEL